MLRRLKITPELWVEFLKNDSPVMVQVIRNALPADARCVRMEAEASPNTYVVLWIESAAFREGDPIDLASPRIRSFD